MSSTSWMPRADSSRLTLRSMSGKNGSEKTRALSSQTMNAMDPVPRADDARGARLRTYPRCAIAASTCCRVSGRTRADPVSTRDAVAGETPACNATSASLGRNFVSAPGTPASSPAIYPWLRK